MTGKNLKPWNAVITVLFFVWCAGAVTQQALALPNPCQPLNKTNYVKKVDNFLVIFDASESMGGTFQGRQKLSFAKDIVRCMNETIPDIQLVGGLRSFGRGYGLFSINATGMLYGMADYSKQGLQAGLDMITFPAGNTPLSQAIAAGTEDLKSAQGDMAVIIVSDGGATTDDPVKAAENMKQTYGDRICIYTITVGNDFAGLHTMKRIAHAGECGFMVTSARIATEEGMTDFVEEVFLKKKTQPVKAAPAPPAAPKVVENIVLGNIQFDTDSAVIKPEFYPVLDNAAKVLQKFGDKKVIVEGHTDSTGSESYNLDLSIRRAESVMKYLVAKGISAERLIVKGYGEQQPIADNTTSEGRRKNRRMEFKVLE